jgi:hypothetical protein
MNDDQPAGIDKAEVCSLKGEPVAVLALAAGATITAAAREAGVSERTIRRRLELPEYRMELSRMRSKLLDAAVGQLVEASTKAVATLVELLGARSENVRAIAAKAIIEYGLSLQEAIETQTRITTLEELYVARRQQVTYAAGN